MRSALENDLVRFGMRADPDHCKNFRDVVRYMFWSLPVMCYGSREVVENWRGLREGERHSGFLAHWSPLDNLDDATVSKTLSHLGENATNDLISLTSPSVGSRISRLEPSRPGDHVKPSEC